MADKIILDTAIRTMRRLPDEDLDLITSLITKKSKDRSAEEVPNDIELVIFDFSYLMIDNNEDFNPLVITSACNKESIKILKYLLENSRILEEKPKYFVSIVSSRIKYDQGNKVIKKWLMRSGIPEAYLDKIILTSCFPERKSSRILKIINLSDGESVLRSLK